MATATGAGTRGARVQPPDAGVAHDAIPRVTPAASDDAEARLTISVSMATVARVVTGLLWVGWAAWTSAQGSVPLAAPIDTVVTAAGLAIVAMALTMRADTALRRLDRVLLGGTIALVVMLPLVAAGALGYLTDELAFDQAAAASLLHGVNPYTVDFTPTLQTFGVGTGTMTLHGTFEQYLSYPALSFLLYVPAVALLGPTSYAGALVDLLAWGVAGAVMWRVLNPRLRTWVPVLLALSPLLGSIIGGVTDSLFVPLELVTFCTWQRFGDPALGRGWRWAGPVCLGLACCVKQQPWFLVPFLLIAVSYEAAARGSSEAQPSRSRWWRAPGQYATLVGVAFLVPNIPFIVWDAHAWVARLLTPLSEGLVPMGIGPASLMQPLSIGGGALSLFTVAAAAALIAAALFLGARYDAMRRALPLLPAAALFLSTRSFASYFLFLIPPAIVNAASVRDARRVTAPRAQRLLLFAATAFSLVAIIAACAGLTVRGPLRIEVAAAHATAAELTVTVAAVNGSNVSVAPHFFLAKGMYYDQVLTKTSGPDVLAPGAAATYEFTAPEAPATPHAGDLLQIDATTVSPGTLSASAPANVRG